MNYQPKLDHVFPAALGIKVFMYFFANGYCHLLPYFLLNNQQKGAFPSYEADISLGSQRITKYGHFLNLSQVITIGKKFKNAYSGIVPWLYFGRKLAPGHEAPI